MPERQIPWRWVAENVAGSLQVTTGLQNSQYRIEGKSAGLRLLLRGQSQPYSLFGSKTEIRVWANHPLRVSLSAYRNAAQVPLYQRFLRRDVKLGDADFDRDWIINAQREAHAQAFLGPQERALLWAVPVVKGNEYYASHSPFENSYDFELRGQMALARTREFEMDAGRMMAAIDALVALAERPKRLLQEYRDLALVLGGQLSQSRSFSMDGRVVIRFASHGRALSLSPIMVKTGWRRDRLRTRIICERATDLPGPSLRLGPESELEPYVREAAAARQAMAAANLAELTLSRTQVCVDLDGHVTEVERLRAASYLAAKLCEGNEEGQGPYR